MGLLEKLETLINKLLFHLGDLFFRLVKKIIPKKIQNAYARVCLAYASFIIWLKALPRLILKRLPGLLQKVKATLKEFDFKSKLQETKKLALDQYAQGQKGTRVSDAKKAFLVPFLIFGQWLKGLSIAQTLVLMSFTAASILASISIIFSGNRMVAQHTNESRAPASVEAEVSYDRPNYYKKQIRHLEITNLRLPVYFSNVNELRTIDVDFSATLSNRLARMKLEKLEFQLRDHLILNVEPMVASFPLVEEGKDILKDKLRQEINLFMIDQEIEGEVKDVELIYILAN